MDYSHLKEMLEELGLDYLVQFISDLVKEYHDNLKGKGRYKLEELGLNCLAQFISDLEKELKGKKRYKILKKFWMNLVSTVSFSSSLI